MDKLTPEIAIETMYKAVREMTLPAQQHEILKECAGTLVNFIKAHQACEQKEVKESK